MGKVRAAGVQGRAQVGLFAVHARRAFCLPADPAPGVRPDARAGEALEPRPIPAGKVLRPAHLSGAGEIAMTVIRLTAAMLLLGLAACGTTPLDPAYLGGSPMIDVPTPPFPYNSKFCT